MKIEVSDDYNKLKSVHQASLNRIIDQYINDNNPPLPIYDKFGNKMTIGDSFYHQEGDKVPKPDEDY